MYEAILRDSSEMMKFRLYLTWLFQVSHAFREQKSQQSHPGLRIDTLEKSIEPSAGSVTGCQSTRLAYLVAAPHCEIYIPIV